MSVAPTDYWVTVLIVGVGTFLLRFSFVHWLGKRELPDRFVAVLGLVPAAVLCALIVPNLIVIEGTFVLGRENPRPFAAAIALLVALKSRNMFLSICAGMLTLWGLQTWWA